MNKKGKWRVVHTIASIIIILGFFGINEIWQIIPQIDLFPNGHVINDDSQRPPAELSPFDFSKTTIVGPKPIKQSMYANSNNIVCYSFKNPTNEINENFTLIGEWFVDDSSEPIKPEYEAILNYSGIFDRGRLNWLFVNDSNKVKFRAALKLDLKPISQEIGYELINKKELKDSLNKDETISWNDNIIKEFIKETAICSKTNDEELAKELMDFVRSYMSPPAKTEDKIYYDNITLSSIEAWNNKIGTSSEYSVVYAMLLRSIGIPSKVLFNPHNNYNYHFVEVYLNNEEWIPVDIYDNNKSVGDLFEKEMLELRKNYHYIFIKGLENIEFISLNTDTPYDMWISLKGTIKSNSDREIKYLKVNITLLDENSQLVYSDWGYLIGYEGLNPNNQTIIELNAFPENLNYIKFINISKLE